MDAIQHQTYQEEWMQLTLIEQCGINEAPCTHHILCSNNLTAKHYID